jgi:hypothetical protein
VLDNGVQPVMELEQGALIPFVRGPIVEATDATTGLVRLTWTAEYAL